MSSTSTEHNGRRYRAQPTAHNVSSCAGCAAAGQGLSRDLRSALCSAMPACAANERGDGRNVIWLEEPTE